MGNCNSDKKDNHGSCAEDEAKKAKTTADASATASDAKGAEESDMEPGAGSVSNGLEKKDLKDPATASKS